MGPVTVPVQDDAPLGLARNAWWAVTCNAGYALTQWFVLVVLARTLSTADVGVFALALAIAGPVTTFTNLKLRQVQVTDRVQRYRFGEYLWTRLAGSGAAIAVVAGVALLLGQSPATLAVILGVAVGKAFESLSDIAHGVAHRMGRLDVVGRSTLLRGVAGAGAFALGLSLSRTLLVPVLVMAVTWACFALYDGLRAARLVDAGFRLPRLPSRSRVTSLIRWTAPLGAATTLGALTTSAPRLILERLEGVESLGVFAVLSYLLVAVGLVATAVGQAVAPQMAALHAEGRVLELRQLVTRLTLLGGGVGVLGIVVAASAGPAVLGLLFGPAYAEEAAALVYLAAAAALGCASMFVGSAVHALQLFKVQAPLHAVVLAVTCVSCLVLVPILELEGAAIGAAIGAAVQAGWYGAIARRVLWRHQ